MEMKKREVREGALILYFEKLFRDDSIDEIFEVTKESGDLGDNIRISEKSRALASKIEEKADEIDVIIGEFSKKRSIERISKINLAILRLGLYEAVYEDKVPVNVAISEAVALAEKYALEQDVAFINGVLGAYSRSNPASADNSSETDE